MKLTEYKSAIKMWAATAALTVSVVATAHGQSTYRIGENGATADAGPVRMARFSLVSGHVDWRPTTKVSWSSASINLPMREGAQVWAPVDSKGEVQFDDGSDMRLGGGAVATLATLYSDDKGEFTEIKLSDGLATIHLKSKDSLYQIDTPTASIKAYGPALIRIGDTAGLEVADRAGQCVVQGQAGQVTLNPTQYIDLPSASASYAVHTAPHEDDWDHFNDQRDEVMYHQSPYLPSNLNVVAGNIDNYGSWHNDSNIGEVWYPREDPNWRPYRDGHWVWVSPFGYTWVGNEPWGWAPYHYGTWRHDHYGWGWRPGPVAQYWSPAVVQFSYYNGNVAWCPLAYGEVQYPSALSIGYASGNWALSFSIGAAGCYYPGPTGAFCVGVPWGNAYCNLSVGFYGGVGFNAFFGGGGYNRYWGGNHRFFPSNARWGGGTFARASQFAGGGGYRGLDPRQANVFRTGRSFTGAPNGRPFSGPLAVRPTNASFTPSRSFGSRGPSAAAMNRPVFRSLVPNTIANHSSGIGRWVNPGPRSNVNAATRGATSGVNRGFNRSSGATPGVNRGSSNRAPASSAQNRYNRFNSVSKSQFTRQSAANRGTTSTMRPQRMGTSNRTGVRAQSNTRTRTTGSRVSAQTRPMTRPTNRSAASNRTRQLNNSTRSARTQSTKTNRASNQSRRTASTTRQTTRTTHSFRPSNRPARTSNRPSRSVSRPTRSSNTGRSSGGGRSFGGGGGRSSGGGGNRGGGGNHGGGGGGGHRGGGGGGGHKHGH